MGFRTKHVTKTAPPIQIRVTATERLELERKAGDCAMSLSEYLLTCGMKRQTRSQIDTVIINKLTDLIDEVKTAFVLSNKQYPELMGIIDASVRAIERIWPTGKIR